MTRRIASPRGAGRPRSRHRRRSFLLAPARHSPPEVRTAMSHEKTARVSLLIGLSIALAYAGGGRAEAAPGDLDTTFGTGGIASAEAGRSEAVTRRVLVGSDGGAVVVASARAGFSGDVVALFRF